MSAALDADALLRFRAASARCFGLQFEDAKLYRLGEVLAERLGASGAAPASYLEHMERGGLPPDELRELARALTIGETYFFRHAEQFRALADVALPARLAANEAAGEIRILSAGCASGEEPYSLAILLQERALGSRWTVTIRGVDVNASLLARARAGCFSEWSFRETPLEMKQRWFSQQGREYTLHPEVREIVAFEEHNFAQEDAGLWRPACYDVVFCRNVLMYLTPECVAKLVARISRAMVPGGYLFLGHAETLRGLSQDFHLCHTHGTFYYQRRKDCVQVAVPESRRERESRADAAMSAALPQEATWIENVRRASERIRSLCDPPPPDDLAPRRPRSTGSDAGDTELGRAFELLRQERFADALVVLPEVPAGGAADVDALLLRAVLLAHSGQTAAAESACAHLLEVDDLNAGAHYVLALCREGAGDRKAAVEHDEAAVYLDPSFAMPRIHLGLMARRAGDRETALRELAEALPLLQREDASRLLLFGGGFRREALVALCRSELAAAGRNA